MCEQVYEDGRKIYARNFADLAIEKELDHFSRTDGKFTSERAECGALRATRF